jgi:hypothetical protein
VFLNLGGTIFGNGDSMNVTGNFVMNSLLLLNLKPEYTPKLDDLVPFIIFTTGSSATQGINRFGAPFKNAEYFFQSHQGFLRIVFSIGSASNPGYVCSYLGKRKNLEMNTFTSQQKIILSLTVPKRDLFIGFGFDLNGTISNSILTISYIGVKQQQIQQWNHNSTIPIPSYLVASATSSKSIFGTLGGSTIGLFISNIRDWKVSETFFHNTKMQRVIHFDYETKIKPTVVLFARKWRKYVPNSSTMYLLSKDSFGNKYTIIIEVAGDVVVGTILEKLTDSNRFLEIGVFEWLGPFNTHIKRT